VTSVPRSPHCCTTNSGARVVSLTQQTIADLLGVQRTSVTRTLRGLQRQGIIEIGYGHIAVRDYAALAEAAESVRAIA
jgi:CRP-like cAMP-binding protein